MADEIVAPAEETLSAADEAVSAVAETKKPVRPRSPFNLLSLKELALAQTVARAAQRAECVGPLAGRNLSSAWVASLLADALSCQTKFGQVLSLQGERTGSTGSESSLHTALLNRVTDAQTSAVQAWSGKQERRGDLDAYGLGQPLRNYPRPALETLVAGILLRIGTDSLPGVTKDSIATLQTTFDAWKLADAAQTTHGADASLLLAEAKKELKSIKNRRIDLQIAADGAFPHYDKDNATLRGEFKLPKSRPYRPVRE